MALSVEPELPSDSAADFRTCQSRSDKSAIDCCTSASATDASMMAKNEKTRLLFIFVILISYSNVTPAIP